MIKQTAEIFEILSKGGFISSDSTNPNIRQLYTVIEDNQSELYDFFAAINFVLESGNEYYYFSRRENKVDLERKLEIAVRWIDVLDFIKTYDAAFSSPKSTRRTVEKQGGGMPCGRRFPRKINRTVTTAK